MSIFNKKETKLKQELVTKSAALFKESVKEINELYDDLKSEYDTIESVYAEFSQFVTEIKDSLDSKNFAKIEAFESKLKKVNSCARNGVRDIRDILRNQKKLLKEIKNEL